MTHFELSAIPARGDGRLLATPRSILSAEPEAAKNIGKEGGGLQHRGAMSLALSVLVHHFSRANRTGVCAAQNMHPLLLGVPSRQPHDVPDVPT